MDNLYANLEKITGKKRKENLTQYKAQAYLSRELVTIRSDIPLNLTLSSFERQPVNPSNLRSFYLDMEFRRFAEAITVTVEKEENLHYKTVQSSL